MFTVAGDISAQGSIYVASESVIFDDGSKFESGDAAKSKSTFTTLNENSAKWAVNEDDITNIANASAGWSATEIELNLKQPRWDSSYTTLTANSAVWTWGDSNSATMYEDLTVHGDVSAQEDIYFTNAYIEDTIYSKGDEDTKIY